MVTLRHRQEGFLEKNQYYENDLSASKGYGNKKYDPLVNLTEFEKAYKYKKEAADSAITPLYFGFHEKKKRRVEIFVKESLKDKVVEDMYFGKDSPATLKKFLDIVSQIKKMISKKKETTVSRRFLSNLILTNLVYCPMENFQLAYLS